MGRVRNQKGFSAVEGLLIAVIVGLIGFVGWYVWHSQNQTNKVLESTNTGSVEPKKKTTRQTQTADPTANWAAFSSAIGKFSLRYPSIWIRNDCKVDGLVLFGPTKETAGICNSDAQPQIAIGSETGDTRKNRKLSDNKGLTFTGLTTTSFNINGVLGVREQGNYKDTSSGQVQPAYPDGAKVVQYLFYVNSRTYFAEYVQSFEMQDLLSEFDTMITKTLQFHS